MIDTLIRTLILLTLSLIFVTSPAQDIKLKLIDAQTDASFRGLSVVDDRNAWVSGSKGYIGRTNDGGSSWKFLQVKGFEKFDFRSIYAFDDNKAVIANAGSPANILLTNDGGITWTKVYTHADTSAFIDGVDFWNANEGLIYGDPLNGKMLLLKTTDGGTTWKELEESQRPLLNNGEASFAASGTNIRCSGNSEVMIATGGTTSRLWYSRDKGSSWRAISAPIIQGEPATGIFSFSRLSNEIVIVGGNYLQDTLRRDHVFVSSDKGVTWSAPAKPTRGYRESVELIRQNLLISAGPGGIDISRNGGLAWEALSDEKYFHAVRKARKGNLVILAGGKGKVAILSIQ